MKNSNRAGKPFWKHPILLRVWLMCSGLSFALLRIGTDWPIWLALLLALPLGLALFLVTIKLAEA